MRETLVQAALAGIIVAIVIALVAGLALTAANPNIADWFAVRSTTRIDRSVEPQ